MQQCNFKGHIVCIIWEDIFILSVAHWNSTNQSDNRLVGKIPTALHAHTYSDMTEMPCTQWLVGTLNNGKERKCADVGQL